MTVAIDEVGRTLRRRGYFVTHEPVAEGKESRFVLTVAGSLGELYVPPDCDPEEPIIWTAPTEYEGAAPFDRAEAIGWHGDFATHEDRPELSLVYITRPDPQGAEFGAWRLASVAKVLAALKATREGRQAVDLLSRNPLPLSYSESLAPAWFHVIEPRPEGGLGMRFYAPSIRRGCIAEYGEVPEHIALALTAVEKAADHVGEVVPTERGSLLIASNWFALHDRVRQSVTTTAQNRQALLCFVV